VWLSILEEEIYSAEFMKIPLFKGRCSIGKQSYRKTNLVSQKKIKNTSVFFKTLSPTALLKQNMT
jgi:hypothetical protein